MLVGTAFVAIACGKRAYVPVEKDGAAPSSSAATVAAPPAIDAGVKLEADEEVEAEPAPPSPLATTCEGVSLVIVSVNLTANPGELATVVELRNGSSKHVPLMLPGDGSTSGRRNPTLRFELTPNDVTPLHGCGNMNGLSVANFAFLGPGEHRQLDWAQLTELPAKPGRYTLRATYRNDPTSAELGDNRPGPKADRLIARARKTVHCTLISNAVAFTWSARARP